ncbi:MAG: S9 family peptidase [Sandarakinorhabdus sp.]|nr:S9 family peptidase [Sandarakinorhabdus sp.]
MKILIAAGLILVAPFATFVPVAPVWAREAARPDDIYQLSMVTDPEVAADGRRLLFTRTAFDRGTDRRTDELWLAHLDETGKVIDRRLLVGRDVRPRDASFSPDGSRIAYLAQHLGKAQIHVMALADGVGRPLTTGDLSPGTPGWSPDGTRLAFVGRVDASPVLIAGMPEKQKGADSAPDPRIISDLFWRADGTGERKPGSTHLFVVDAASGVITQLTTGDKDRVGRNGGLSWTADGRSIVAPFTADPINGPRETDLYVYDAAGATKAPMRLTSRPGSEFQPRISPDGRTIAFLGSEASAEFYDMPELWTAPFRAGAVPRKLSASLDRPVAEHSWREDGGAILALYHDEGVTRVGEIDAATGAVRILVPLVGGTRLYLPSAGGDFSAARGTIAYTSAFTDRPAGLGVSRGAEETGAIDFNAAWAKTRLASRIVEVTVASRADGRRVQGWIAYPPGFDPKKRYPMILDIHGGPNTDYGPFYSITHSLYAAAGYIVLFGNPRGSIGYGREFANLITNAYPGKDHDDLMTMVDTVAARSYVDGRNLFIGGGSGGGLLALWAIGKEPDKFRAAVALRPVVDWTNQVTTSDGTAFFMKHWMGATPWEKPDLYFRRSPFSLVGQVRTPTLLITGEEDYRTPISQTEQYFGALKLRGVDTMMIRLPGAGHGMGRPSQWLQSILAPINYFNERKAR